MTKDILRVNGTLDKKIFSEIFDINRGVVQGDREGDIVSPIVHSSP